MRTIKRVTKEEAITNLVQAATKLVNNARWNDFCTSKINELRLPLLQLRRANRFANDKSR